MSWLLMLSQYMVRIYKEYFKVVSHQKRSLRMEQYRAWQAFTNDNNMLYRDTSSETEKRFDENDTELSFVAT